ncbi:hypothetical protein [Aeromonas sp.]|uniref:hypothetical protein n=1 Tax=Aeromonas sp. TaxID=647 RepID=UPI00258CE774|nr:hypothetical protein [Aeromonas sp.]MCX7128042.1 hypothetical protein [Aeromonas sp.]
MAYQYIPDTNDIFITEAEITDFRGTNITIAQSGLVNSMSTAVQRYDFKVKVQAMNPQAIRELQAFLAEHQCTPFYIKLPLISSTASSNSFVSQDVPPRSSSIEVSGHRGVINRGDYLSFLNHNKLYQALNTVERNGQLKITPPLRAQLKAQDQVILVDQKVLVLLTSTETEVKHSGSFRCAEFSLELKERF